MINNNVTVPAQQQLSSNTNKTSSENGAKNRVLSGSSQVLIRIKAEKQ